MPKRIIRVFVASPGDVLAERDALTKLITELDLTITFVAPEKEISLDAVRWETHAFPAAGRPQSVINEQIGEYDIFVGIMWSRFGTSSGVAESGTEEEFNFAYEAWQQFGKPQIMFYFCQAPRSLTTIAEIDQLKGVIKFREKLAKMALVWEYNGHSDFADTVRPHLLQALRKAFAAGQDARQVVTGLTSGSNLEFVRAQLLQHSNDYSRIRASMPSGDARTRQMELIVTKMRTVALAATPILPSLVDSHEPGERLAAISILQVTPQADYIEWLVERCFEKQPFVGYHAAVAVRTSVRTLDCAYRHRLEAAIGKGLAHFAARQGSDRYRMLAGALEELRKRCPSTDEPKQFLESST